MFSEWLLSLRVKCQSIKCQCKNAQLHRRMHIYIHTQEILILHKPVNAHRHIENAQLMRDTFDVQIKKGFTFAKGPC